jgi:hypothetical protein
VWDGTGCRGVCACVGSSGSIPQMYSTRVFVHRMSIWPGVIEH